MRIEATCGAETRLRTRLYAPEPPHRLLPLSAPIFAAVRYCI